MVMDWDRTIRKSVAGSVSLAKLRLTLFAAIRPPERRQPETTKMGEKRRAGHYFHLLWAVTITATLHRVPTPSRSEGRGATREGDIRSPGRLPSSMNAGEQP